MTASKKLPQSNRAAADVPKTRAPGVPPARNPPMRPAEPARQQPGEISLGHHPSYSKSPGSRE
jgi:hypothetical protein